MLNIHKLFTRNTGQGFTIAETAMVTAILGVLAAVSIPPIMTTGSEVQNKAETILHIQELAQKKALNTLTPAEETELNTALENLQEKE